MDSPSHCRKCRTARLPSWAPTSADQIDALDDQSELRGLDRARRQLAVGRERRAEAPSLESLGPHRESVPIPVHDAYAVGALREEDKEVAAQRSVPEHVAYQHHQAVGAFAAVDWLR